jgi:DNA polymerase-3 subunit epsilon
MTTWTDAPLVALDLEGSGAQDRDHEAIIEIAVVPLIAGKPSITDAYTTLINPGRPIPQRPWISPGLTDSILASAPALSEVAPELTARIDGKVLVGHNVGVDYRLLRQRCPGIRPQALIDTLRLARHVHHGAKGNSLSALLDRHRLTAEATRLAPSSQPHRALWDTVATALLLTTLISDFGTESSPTLSELLSVAGLPVKSADSGAAGPGEPQQAPLFEL